MKANGTPLPMATGFLVTITTTGMPARATSSATCPFR